jgi:hypothetical protein
LLKPAQPRRDFSASFAPPEAYLKNWQQAFRQDKRFLSQIFLKAGSGSSLTSSILSNIGKLGDGNIQKPGLIDYN